MDIWRREKIDDMDDGISLNWKPFSHLTDFAPRERMEIQYMAEKVNFDDQKHEFHVLIWFLLWYIILILLKLIDKLKVLETITTTKIRCKCSSEKINF
jgi:hypothetical protein